MAVLKSTSTHQEKFKQKVFLKTIFKEIKLFFQKLFKKLFEKRQAEKEKKALEIYLVDCLVTHFRSHPNFDPTLQFGADEALILLQPFLSTY